MKSVYGTELKLHYYAVNSVPFRNVWKMRASFCYNILDFKTYLFNFRVRREKIQFSWENEWWPEI